MQVGSIGPVRLTPACGSMRIALDNLRRSLHRDTRRAWAWAYCPWRMPEPSDHWLARIGRTVLAGPMGCCSHRISLICDLIIDKPRRKVNVIFVFCRSVLLL